MKKIGVFFGSTSGKSGAIAEEIEFYLKKEDVSIHNVADGLDNIKSYNNLIFISPTYGVGELQKDWESHIDTLKNIDMSGKIIGLIGLGNQYAFGESYVGAIKILYDIIIKNNGKVIGFTPSEGYLYKESEAVIDGKFVGLALDEENQRNQTPDRIKNWIVEIISLFN
ncbi:MAG: flavodoxin [Fusobacteriaceae bacterium]|jgi:flavodoxin I|nr:flavodoxin [Fusobacteriaceae bacterium]